jgi:hypothetical protein
MHGNLMANLATNESIIPINPRFDGLFKILSGNFNGWQYKTSVPITVPNINQVAGEVW